MVSEADRGSSLQLITLLLLANNRGELADVMSRFDLESVVDECLRDIERDLENSEYRYRFKELPIRYVLQEVRRAILASRHYEPYSFDILKERFEGSVFGQYMERLEDFSGDVEEFESHLERIDAALLSLTDRQLSTDWSLSLGAAFGTMRTHRTAPVRVYTVQAISFKAQSELESALIGLLNEYGFETDLDLPAESGSFWKRFWVRTKNIATHREVEERFIKLERALETKHIEGPQAEANKLNADAFSAIMNSLEGVGG